jgi:repressor LexA
VADRPTLTRVQACILSFIRAEIRRVGYPPSVRDVAKHADIRSTSTAAHHLRALEHKGYIVRDPNKARAIRIQDVEEP